MNHLDAWRPEIERRAGAALGLEVQIGHIATRSGSWVPALSLRDVVLRDAAGRETLRLPQVEASLSPRSLLALAPRLSQLLVRGAELEVRHDAAGRWIVAGFPLGRADDSPEAQASPDALDWLLRHRELVVQDGTLHVVDEARGRRLTLSDVDVVVRNTLRRHALRVDATPPAEAGSRFTLQGLFSRPLLSRPGDWRRWTGQWQADLPSVDLEALGRMAALPVAVEGGAGAVRAWLAVDEGQPRELTTDLALRDVRLHWSGTGDPDFVGPWPASAAATGAHRLGLSELQGRVVLQGDAAARSVETQDLRFVTDDGAVWPAGHLRLAWRQADAPAAAPAPAPAASAASGPAAPDAAAPPSAAPVLTGGEFEAGRFDLSLARRVAARLPLPAPMALALDDQAPEGLAEDVSLRWDGPLSAPTRYAVRGRLSDFSLAARPPAPGVSARPGVQAASLSLEATEQGGTAQVAVREGALELPGWFEPATVPLQRFEGRLQWTLARSAPGQPPSVDLRVEQARLANADLQAEFGLRWQSPAGALHAPATPASGGEGPRPRAGRIELDGRLERVDASAFWRYLPLTLPSDTRRYVRHAIGSGHVANGTFRVHGDLADFPFRDARLGEFRLVLPVEDLDLAYVPTLPAEGEHAAYTSPWPPFSGVTGTLVFDRVAMQLHEVRARVGGFALAGVNGGIADLNRQPVLALAGRGQGPVSEGLAFVEASPVGAWIGGALSRTTATGAAELGLSLSLPLQALDESQVEGSVTLAGNDLQLRPDLPLLAQARGRVEFRRRGFTLVGTTARVVGGEVSVEGGTQPDGSLRFTAQGTASAEGLRRATEFAPWHRLAQAFSGQTPYRLVLGFAHDRNELSLTSPLTGLTSTLPAPFAKAADASMPLRVQLQPLAAGPGGAEPAAASAPGAQREWLRIDVGSTLQAQFLREHTADGALHVLRGGIGLHEPAPTPARGVQVHGTLDELDVDAWRPWVDRLQAAAEPGSAAATGSTAEPAGTAGQGSASAEAWPSRGGFAVGALTAGGRRLDHVVAGFSREDGLWRTNVAADQLEGYLEYRPPPPGDETGGQVKARFSRLVLPKSEVERFESLLDEQPASMPDLDIEVEAFELRGKRLGRLDIEAANRPGDARHARDWELSRFNLSTPEAQFNATGHWRVPPGASAQAPRRATMDFRLDITDGGALLKRLGIDDALRGGKGAITGQVGWQGSPLSPEVASLDGRLHLAVESGRFVRVDPGAGRLLSVLSLQSLPRRLALDFRDVFEEGFPFDQAVGDAQLQQGVLSTNNFRMRGVQAAVLMEGQVDLAGETQDLRAIVVPEINAGTASLAYAAINPAIGLGTFLAQWFLRRPMMQAGTREFRISGPWADPKVERVERAPGAPLPDMELPPEAVEAAAAAAAAAASASAGAAEPGASAEPAASAAPAANAIPAPSAGPASPASSAGTAAPAPPAVPVAPAPAASGTPP